MTSSGRSIPARMQRVRRLARMGARRAVSVKEREWFGPAALIDIAAAAASAGAFTETGWAALTVALHDFPAHAAFWTGLRELSSLTDAIGETAEELSDATEPTTSRLERSGDVWRVVA